VNYDLHNVLGFYVWLIALTLAATGLVWGFQWFADGVYAAAGGEKKLLYSEPLSDTTVIARAGIPAVDKVFELMKIEYPAAKSLEVHIPENEASVISVNANPDNGTNWKLDYRYYDQHTLRELSVDHIYGRFSDATGADKLLRMNYDIHTGAIWGLTGKSLMFFAGLICASLPVTGVYIWWGRRKKEKRAGSKVKRQPDPKALKNAGLVEQGN
jgi:uncharacterized iron-regulated membrane protein